MKLSPFFKQLYVALAPFLAGMSAGGAVCFPAVLMQQLKERDTSIVLDLDTTSWLGSIHGITGVPGIFVPTLMQWKGRKPVFILTSLITITGWVVAYFAPNATALIVAESLHGLGTSSLLTVSCLSMTELMSPKYRDTMMQILYITETIGMAAEGLLSQYYHWRTMCIISLVPVTISVLVTCTLPESPYWLAYKGDLEKCKENYIWLRGSDEASKKELNYLMSGRIENNMSFGIKSVKDFWEKITAKDFYVPAVHIILLQFVTYGSGSLAMLIYPIVVLQKITGNDKISAYGSFIMNVLLCLGLCTTIVLDKYFKKKPVVLTCIFGAGIFMLILCIFSYCQSVGSWPNESLVGLYCLSGFMFCSSVGILGTTYSIGSTLMPVKNRGVGGALILINTGLFHTISLKIAPYMFLHCKMWGSFLIYASLAITCGLLILKYIPEIKGRTLTEIENYYKYGSYSYNQTNSNNVDFTNIPRTVRDREMQLLHK